jgi:hypothetical protein
MTNQISALTDMYQSLASGSAQNQATSAGGMTPFYTQIMSMTLAGLNLSGNLEASGTSHFAGAVLFDSVATFFNKLVVKGEVVFEQALTVLGNVTFKGKITVNNDTAGTAVIPKYGTSVDIAFDKPYDSPPMVMLTLAVDSATDSAFLSDGAKAAVANVTQSGFTIVLDSPTLRDLTYNWFAFTVENGRKTVGKPLDGLAPDLTQISPTPMVLGDSHSGQTSAPAALPTPIDSGIIPTAVPAASPTSAIAPSLTPTVMPRELPLASDLNSAPTPAPQIPTVSIPVNAVGYVNLRVKPDATTESLDQIPVGETVPYTDNQFGWYKVVYKGQIGWVSGTFVMVNQ